MIRSMTGFGAASAKRGGEEISVEIRSVNHKFCEVKVRLPRELLALEQDAVRLVKKRLARGGVEVTLRRSADRSAVAPRVDLPLARAYQQAYQSLQGALGLGGSVPLETLVAAEGVLVLDECSADLDSARAALATAMDGALDSLTAMRQQEGDALARDIAARLTAVQEWLLKLHKLAPQSVDGYRARLEERIREITRGMAIDPGRLAQEVALFADRVDITEEFTRLASHLEQMRALTGSSEPAGRKMDFLVQEMNREVNTIGSKAQNAEIAGGVVEMKAEIERMREQVQNVE
jgi:uncharacterized protein (TIGR00255 family)